MNTSFTSKLSLPVAIIALTLLTFIRLEQVQRRQYPLTPSATGNTPPVTTYRPVSPLFSPDYAAELLEGAGRDRWQKPQELVAALKIQPGEVVADIGAGSGYLMPYLSRAVGSQGLVYEEEIQAAFLRTLEQKAHKRNNVQVVLGRAEDPRLPRGSVDCFVLLTVYHEVEKPVAFLHTLRASARPNARLAIIDFDAQIKGDPPAPEGHWIARQTVIDEANAAGWELTAEKDLLHPASQFYLIFRPQRGASEPASQ